MKQPLRLVLFLLFLGLPAWGCTSGSMAGGTKGKAKGGEEETDEDLEDEGADTPQEVSGAFLVGCAEAPDEAAPSGSVMMGCYVRDVNTAKKLAVENFAVTVQLKDGSSESPTMKAMADDSQWNGVFEMTDAKHDQLERMDVGFRHGGKRFVKRGARAEPEFDPNLPAVILYAFTTSEIFAATSETEDPFFEGIAGANEICNEAAADIPVKGTWQAYLSTNGGFPVEVTKETVRLARSAAGPAADVIAAQFQREGGSLFRHDESGKELPEGGTLAWTGIGDRDGRRFDCDKWKGKGEGFYGNPFGKWASDDVDKCDKPMHLYCVLLKTVGQ